MTASLVNKWVVAEGPDGRAMFSGKVEYTRGSFAGVRQYDGRLDEWPIRQLRPVPSELQPK